MSRPQSGLCVLLQSALNGIADKPGSSFRPDTELPRQSAIQISIDPKCNDPLTRLRELQLPMPFPLEQVACYHFSYSVQIDQTVCHHRMPSFSLLQVTTLALFSVTSEPHERAPEFPANYATPLAVLQRRFGQ